MKRFTFASLLLFTAAIISLTSCGGGDSKDKKDGDTTTVDNTIVPEASTVITTPQNMMIATHKVADFAKWKVSYDAHDAMRLSSGIHSYVIGRGVDDSNMVMVAVKAEDMEKAKAFAKDPGLKNAMQKGGVIGTPTFTFVNTVWQDTAVISAPIRSRTTFTVKDWGVWEKNFAAGKQERMDNGILDRAYGHDVDDNKKIFLVTAVTDTAKAFAYYKSDALKKRREAGGVVGEPERFLFKVVARY